MKTLLLIGGAGFFGKSFLDCYKRGLLARWGITKIIIMSRNVERLRIETPELLDSSIQLVIGDIGKVNSLPKANYVIHAAASTDAQSYLSQPEIEKRNIQAGIYNYCKLAEVTHKNSKILYVSSGAVYGPQPSYLEQVSESYEFNPLESFVGGKRDYAFAKRDAEYAIQNLGRENLNVAIARCFAFVGPWLPRDQHFAIGNFLEDGLLGRVINVRSTFPVYRSYMHSDDLVNWLMTICESANSCCPIYNVGSDEAIAIDDLGELIASIFGIQVHKAKLAHDKVDRYIPSITKAKKELGLYLKTNLIDSIKLTIKSIKYRRLYDK